MATNTDEIKKLKKQIKELKDIAEEKEQMKQEKEQMKQEIEELKKIIKASFAQPQEIISNNQDRDILFTSLYPGILNLSTEGYGKGDVFTFEKFGEEVNIPYSQARQIIRNNKSFITGGLVFISDDEIIKSERLTNDYKKILNKEKLLKTFEMNKNEFKDIFEAMTDSQKEILHQTMINRLVAGKDVDMNMVSIVNNAMNCDILKEVNDGKGLTEE